MKKTILYFTSTRWVAYGKVIARVLTLWEPLDEYFLNFLPTNQKTQIQNHNRYDRFKLSLTSYTIKIQLQFVLFLCETIFDHFLTLFQQEASFIHLLPHELSALYRTVLVQFLAPDYVGNETGGELLDLDFKLNEKQLNNKQIPVPGLLNNREIDHARDEWLNYSLEGIDEKWFIKEKKMIVSEMFTLSITVLIIIGITFYQLQQPMAVQNVLH